MPIHPGMVEPLADRTRDLYAAAEERLLGIIARQLADGLEAPGWAARKLAAVQAMRRSAQGVVDELGRAAQLEVFDAVAEAYNVGHRAAVAEIGALPDAARRLVDDVLPNAQAVDRIAQETVDVVTSTHRSILRAVVDGFRNVVSEVIGAVSLGIATRRQATQDAMRRFTDRGIRAFVDKAGRRWQLTSYAEMAVRTGTARAATEAHTRTLTDAGIDLVIVSDAPRECPLCRPWEGRILALSGAPGPRTVEVEHAIDDGRMVRVHVAGTLDEARLAGFQHPNCRHSVSAYTPGITPRVEATSDPEGYEAGQRQRAIERNIRKYKRRQAGAPTPEAKRAAGAKVRQWQTAMRDHLAAHPDLRRLRHREQPGASNLPDTRTAPAGTHVQAARVRAGDPRTLAEMSDEQLTAAMQSASLGPDEYARIAAEIDRRHPATLPAPAASGDAVDDLLADRDALAATADPVPDPAGWGALADDETFAAQTAAAAAAHEAEQEAAGEAEPTHRVTRAEARAMYDEYVYRQYLSAEDDLRGVLLTKQAAAAGHDPVSLFSGPARIAYARASDELKEWWAEHGRLTQAEFIEKATGRAQRWAAGARKAEADQQAKR